MREDEEFSHLGLQCPEEFTYLSHGECTEIDGVDDMVEFEATKKALDILGKGK